MKSQEVIRLPWYRSISTDKSNGISADDIFYRIKCRLHESEQASRFCESCEKFFCLDCHENHIGHQHSKLKDKEEILVSQAIKKLEYIQTQIEKFDRQYEDWRKISKNIDRLEIDLTWNDPSPLVIERLKHIQKEMKNFKLDYDFLRASIRAASGPIGIPIQPLITKLKAYRSRGTDKFLFLAHLQKETIKSETLPRINWSTAWLNFDQPIFIDLTAENLDRSKNFSVNGIDYVIKIEKSQKEKNKAETEDLWKDPSPRKENTEKPKNLNFEKFLSIHIHEKHDSDQNLNLQSLVRLTSEDRTRYYLPGRFTNRKSEFFFPLKKLNPKSFELSLQLKPPSIFNCVTNLTHWTTEIIERSEKLAQLQKNLTKKFAEIENETRSLA